MGKVSISQLWGRAWELFKANWLLLLGLLILYVIVTFIPILGYLLAAIILGPASTRAGYLIARHGKASFEEAFGDLLVLLKIFLYNLVLFLIPGALIGGGYAIVFGSLAREMMDSEGGGLGMLLGGTEGLLVIAGFILLIVMGFFGWAGSYVILSGRAGVIGALGQSFSLTGQNFGIVLLAFLSLIGLMILGAIPCGLGLLIVVPLSQVFLPLLYLSLSGENLPTLF